MIVDDTFIYFSREYSAQKPRMILNDAVSSMRQVCQLDDLVVFPKNELRMVQDLASRRSESPCFYMKWLKVKLSI